MIQPWSPSISCQISTPATKGTTYGRKNRTRNSALADEELAVQEQGDRERHDDRDRQPDQREPQRHAERRPDLLVVEQPGVVVQADEREWLVLGQGEVDERERQRGDHRQEREGEEADDPGQREQEPQRASRRARGDRCGRRRSPDRPRRAVATSPTGLMVTKAAYWSQAACNAAWSASISASMSRSGVLPHLVRN